MSATAMKEPLIQRIRDHFLNPRNQGEIPDPDVVLETGSISKGNAVKLMMKLDESDRISEAKFQAFGACESVAALSILTELLVGKTRKEAASITEKDIFDWVLGSPGLPMFETGRALSLLHQTYAALSPIRHRTANRVSANPK